MAYIWKYKCAKIQMHKQYIALPVKPPNSDGDFSLRNYKSYLTVLLSSSSISISCSFDFCKRHKVDTSHMTKISQKHLTGLTLKELIITAADNKIFNGCKSNFVYRGICRQPKPKEPAHRSSLIRVLTFHWFVCVEVLRPSQPNGVMSSAVSLPNHTFTGQA